jgi:hypothetical protein
LDIFVPKVSEELMKLLFMTHEQDLSAGERGRGKRKTMGSESCALQDGLRPLHSSLQICTRIAQDPGWLDMFYLWKLRQRADE